MPEIGDVFKILMQQRDAHYHGKKEYLKYEASFAFSDGDIDACQGNKQGHDDKDQPGNDIVRRNKNPAEKMHKQTNQQNLKAMMSDIVIGWMIDGHGFGCSVQFSK